MPQCLLVKLRLRTQQPMMMKLKSYAANFQLALDLVVLAETGYITTDLHN